MADTGKSIRASRTDLNGSLGNQAPSEHTQVVAQEVHQFRSASEGLEGLSTAFANFFGSAINALDSVQKGVMVGQEERIRQQNEAQKQQALGDALAGKPMDNALAGDNDYYQAYRQVKAQRDGFEASQDFNKFYLEQWLPQNPTGDLEQARMEWARKNLTGTQDPSYDGQVLASFFSATDGMIPQHQEYALKYQTAKGVENLSAAVDAQVASGTMDAASLNDYIAKMRVLDPLNATEAPSRVASALLASAQNHPEQMMAISNLLSTPGTGMNGKSFSQSWPQAYADFEGKAVTQWQQLQTVGDLKTMADMEDRLRNATSMDDLVNLTVDAYKFRQQRGAIGQVDTLLNAIQAKAAKYDQQEQSMQGVDKFLGGDASAADPSDVRKNWDAWMQSRLGTNNIMALDPKTAVSAIQGLQGVVPDGLRVQLSSALTSDKNPAAQAQAIQVVNALGQTTGVDYAKQYLDEPAKRLYDNVQALLTAGEPMDAVLKQVNEGRANVKNWDADWKTITGSADPASADKAVQDVISQSLKDGIGSEGGFLGIGSRTAQVPLDLQKTIMDIARIKAVEAQSNGRGWQAGVKDAINEVAANSEVIPGLDGSLVLKLNADQDTRYIDENGHEAERPRLGPSVVNPATGQPVDTISVYNQQRDQLAKTQPWVFPHGAAGIHLGDPADRNYAPYGLLPVLDDGIPIVYAAGQKVSVRGPDKAPQQRGGLLAGSPEVFNNGGSEQTVTLPSTEAEMNKLFPTMPEGFHFIRRDTPHGTVWMLGYRPNWGDKGGLTLDQKAAQFGGGW